MMRPHGFPPRSWQTHHPTRATKLDLLNLVARCGEVDVATVAQHFRMTESGAKVKLWRLTKQTLLEVNPESHKPRTWRLTRSGWRHLRHLREAENYGGTQGLLIANLTAEVARLKGESDHWRQIVEDRSDIFQENVQLANENVTLRRERDQARAEIRRLRAQVAVHQSPLPSKPRTKL
jgi:predicted ArsR family transcriptional regulator